LLFSDLNDGSIRISRAWQGWQSIALSISLPHPAQMPGILSMIILRPDLLADADNDNQATNLLTVLAGANAGVSYHSKAKFGDIERAMSAIPIAKMDLIELLRLTVFIKDYPAPVFTRPSILDRFQAGSDQIEPFPMECKVQDSLHPCILSLRHSSISSSVGLVSRRPWI
jgi:hypothetical protein